MNSKHFSWRFLSAISIAAFLHTIPISGLAAPVVESVQGQLTNGATLTISGSGFSTKQNDKPLFWWTADGGDAPLPLGRMVNWSGGLDGDDERQKVNVAPGSTYSYRFNHENGGAALGRIDFDSTRVYMWRKKYNAFDIVKDQGSKGFNFKTFRFWPPGDGSRNNAWCGAQGSAGYSFRCAVDYTNGTIWDTGASQQPYSWKNEQVVYEASDLNQYNGRVWFAIDNVFGFSDLVCTRNSEFPGYYDELFQSQVSNGTAGNTWVYYDSIYVDDSWHRVLLSSASNWTDARDVEIQIPVSWDDDKIEISARLGSLDPNKPVYLYVVDSENRVNENGRIIDDVAPPAQMPPPAVQ